jgi:hypothetical protein
MELMTRIQSEQHSSKELVCKLTQQEDELKVLRETVSNFVILIILKYTIFAKQINAEGLIWP